jgi:molybdopterin-guanine dinucleotide biosynthesis protein MobB
VHIIGIVGWKNSGKTTLIEHLIRIFIERGLTVATIKHAHHAFDIDHPGKDSYRHRAAGAEQVIAVSNARWALMRELTAEEAPDLDYFLERSRAADLVLVEGYKGHAHAKIEVVRDEWRSPLAGKVSDVVAVATNVSGLIAPVPVLPLDEPEIIADFAMTCARPWKPYEDHIYALE